MLCSVEAAATPTYDIQQLINRLNSEFKKSSNYLNHNNSLMCNKTVDFYKESYLIVLEQKSHYMSKFYAKLYMQIQPK